MHHRQKGINKVQDLNRDRSMQTRDEEVKNLSNRKLWSLIDESSQMRINNTLVSAVMLELIRRNQLNSETRWKMPH